MVPAEARPAGIGRFLRPLLSSADVVVSTSMMSSVMPALACKQDVDGSTLSVYVTFHTLFHKEGDMLHCVHMHGKM
jgi:hypothetical protein